MKRILPKVILLTLLTGAHWGTGWAETEGQSLLPAGPGPVGATSELALKVATKVSPNVYRIGTVTVDLASREVRFAGKINMATGVMEVLVCTIYGKTHESVISTTIRPLDLHLALLLLGLQNGYNPGWPEPDDPQFKKEGWGIPRGDQVDVTVEWELAGKPMKVRVEQLLKDCRTGEPLPQTGWVFVGSFVDERGTYLADAIGSIITNYQDGSSVLDCPLKAARSDDYLVVNDPIVPPVNTPVEIRIVPAKEPPKTPEEVNPKP